MSCRECLLEAHLLESNDIPLDSEILSIRQIISDNKARVDEVNAQIDVLRTAMQWLIAERGEREEYIRKYTSVANRRRYNKLPPGVSDIPAGPGLCAIYPLFMVETQLLRSGNAPLAVNFDSYRFGDVDELQLWSLLLPHCDRWGAVHLRSRTQTSTITLSNLLHDVQGCVPQLKNLELAVHADHTIPFVNSTHSILPPTCAKLSSQTLYTDVPRSPSASHGPKSLVIADDTTRSISARF
ncbi:hypothetical protein C8R44DRAFT_978181 [Mycena epipterygia]|nr:hypothetical protein C8R44DRAFT_978181 [Mycena epipterygia]